MSKIKVTGVIPLESRPVNVAVFTVREFTSSQQVYAGPTGTSLVRGRFNADESFMLEKIIQDLQCHHAVLRVIASPD